MQKPGESVGDFLSKLFLGVFPPPSDGLDLFETGEEIVVRIDLPGCDPDAIGLRMGAGVLEVAARREENAPEGAVWRTRDRAYGTILRRILLPAGISGPPRAVSFLHGTLSVAIPKAAARPRWE